MNNNSKRILITGGAGFIGSNLALKLLEEGYSVRVLDSLSPQVHGEKISNSYTFNLIKNKVEFIWGSILSVQDVLNALDGINILIHMAAETGTGQSMYDITLHTETNINGLANIYEQIIKNKIKLDKIILPSSRSVYGEGKYLCAIHGNKYPVDRDNERIKKRDYDFYCSECGMQLTPVGTDESSPVNLKSVYAYTKYSQEQLAQLMSKTLKIPTLIFRLQNVYGIGQSLTNPYTGIVSIFSNLIRNQKEINVFEDGRESRDFVNVNDVSKFIVKFLSINTAEYEIYNIGSGERVNVLEIIDLMSTLMQVEPRYSITGQYRVGDIRHNFANIDKLKNKIQTMPSISLKKGINDLLKWVKIQENLPLSDKYSESIDALKKYNLYK